MTPEKPLVLLFADTAVASTALYVHSVHASLHTEPAELPWALLAAVQCSAGCEAHGLDLWRSEEGLACATAAWTGHHLRWVCGCGMMVWVCGGGCVCVCICVFK